MCCSSSYGHNRTNHLIWVDECIWRVDLQAVVLLICMVLCLLDKCSTFHVEWSKTEDGYHLIASLVEILYYLFPECLGILHITSSPNVVKNEAGIRFVFGNTIVQMLCRVSFNVPDLVMLHLIHQVEVSMTTLLEFDVCRQHVQHFNQCAYS